VRSLYRSGFFTTAARELSRYILDLVGAQEVGKRGHGKSRGLYFFY